MKEEEKNTLPGISGPLLAWYSGNRRSLPWRDDPSAYHVWISEIMLQQTRVEAVKGYYARFLERFPDIRALAEADEDTCLKLWEGLGYYSRARNLQKAARLLVADYGGEMPRHSGELRKLPGIGPYTAAAIASIAFGERIPAIDGNLLRVFSRRLRNTTIPSILLRPLRKFLLRRKRTLPKASVSLRRPSRIKPMLPIWRRVRPRQLIIRRRRKNLML